MSNSQVQSTLATPAFGFSNLPAHVKPAGYKFDGNHKGSIVHIGPGGFFMAHFAAFVHDYMAKSGDLNWGITVASLRSPGTITGLRKQDNLYVLVEREGTTRKASVLAPIVDTIFAPDSPSVLVDAIANDSTKIVSMTITNKGYYLADSAAVLDYSHHDIIADLELEVAATEGEGKKTPKTVYWYLLNGLLKRFAERGVLEPLTVMSLDNVPENSKSLKKGLLQFIEASGQSEFSTNGVREKLLLEVEANVDFLTTLVDRITPEVTAAFRKEAAELVQFNSDVVIGTEVFRQLVVEKGRFELPDWEQVGVEMVDDCSSWWELKFLGLNAAHQVPAIVGQRLGDTYVHEAMADEGIAALTELFHKDLGVILGEERMAKYGAKIRTRFADSAPMDTLRRVGARGTSKASERILFAVERAHKLSDGRRILKAPTFVAACWLLNLGNTDEFGHHFQQDDVELPKLTEVYQAVLNLTRSVEPQAHELAHILRKTGESVRDNRFVQMAGVDAFVQELLWALTTITKLGTSSAIAALLARESESASAAAQLVRESESAAVVSK